MDDEQIGRQIERVMLAYRRLHATVVATTDGGSPIQSSATPQQMSVRYAELGAAARELVVTTLNG